MQHNNNNMLSLLLLIFVVCCSGSLYFKEDGTFKIVQFTDLHFYNVLDDALTLDVQKITLNNEKKSSPIDIVVLTGDVLAGSSISNTTHGKNHAASEWEKMAGPMIERGLSWAMTFGNHDDDGPLTREEMMQIDTSLPGSLSQFGPEDLPGVSNYYLPVYTNSSETEIAAVLYFLATSDYGCGNLTNTGDGCVVYEQINWYKDLSLKLRGSGNPIYSLMFMHIPIPEFVPVWNDELCYGSKEEDVCCPTANTGLYDAMVEMGDVRMLAVGHDHNNDYCCAFAAHPELSLCYGRKTGFGYYNPPWPMHHGARVIELYRDSVGAVSMATWIRDDLGNKVVQEAHFPEHTGQAGC